MTSRFVPALALALLLVGGRVEASPIGTFSWDTDSCGAFAPCFTIQNLTDILPFDDPADLDFLHVLVTFDAGTPTTLVPGSLAPDADLTLGPGEGASTIAALPAVQTALVTLSFTLANGLTWQLLDENGAPIAGLTGEGQTAGIALIDAPAPAPVPEPGTLALLGSGLVLAVTRRRRR